MQIYTSLMSMADLHDEYGRTALYICVQLTILVWAKPKIKRPGASRSPIVHLRISRSTQVAGETTP